MIVVALILINFIIKEVKIKKILVSAYAMKEGILWEMKNS
jgi:exopolyphosphatase/pppGpp-phosphohydrolase